MAVTHEKYGEPLAVLGMTAMSFSPPALASDEVIIKVAKRPIHIGDLLLIRAAPCVGKPVPIARGSLRVPGVEGVGTLVRVGDEVRAKQHFADGERVVFYMAKGAWGEYVVAKAEHILRVPDSVSDAVAAQMIYNPFTAFMVLRSGVKSMGASSPSLIHVVQNAALSCVSRLLTRLLLDRGLVPFRLVRSHRTAQKLERLLPGAPIFVTAELEWKVKLRQAMGECPLQLAFDAVGATSIEEFASLLDEHGTIVNYGSLGQAPPNILTLAFRNVALKSVSVGNWCKEPPDQKASDLAMCLRLAQQHSELFQIAADFPLRDFKEAIRHMESQDRSGLVLLSG
jgi:NADPH:quinone reductase